MKRQTLLVILSLVAIIWVADQLGWIPGLTTLWPSAPSPTPAATTAPTAPGAPSGIGGRRRGGAGADTVPVLVAPVRQGDVPVTVDTVGTVQALNTVTVRTQVDGRLLQLLFKDGQDVAAGDPLALIDPVTYKAAFDQAVAKKAQDEAQLANARLDLGRYMKLATTNYGSQQQADTQKALVAQLEAQVRVDQGAIDNAKAVLDYTTIRAPLSGRTGIRMVDAGNIVHTADTTGLVTVTQVRPITVLFSLPQQNLLTLNRALARGAVRVQALQSDNVSVLAEGTVEVVDNLVDVTTGTVKVKATFANDTLQLWPGQFVNVRLYVDVLSGVLIVPTSAVQRGPDGAFVYVLQDDTVALRKIDVTRQNETEAVIASADVKSGDVKAGDKVVTTGFSQLTDGKRVRADSAVVSGDAPAAKPADQPRDPQATPRAPGDPNRPHRRRDGAGGAGAADAPPAPVRAP